MPPPAMPDCPNMSTIRSMRVSNIIKPSPENGLMDALDRRAIWFLSEKWP